MKAVYLLRITLIFILLFSGLLWGQNTMVLLPLQSIGVDATSIQTVESLLKQEIEKLSAMQILDEEQTLEIAGEKPCQKVDCAVEIGKQLQADQVVYGSLNKLGEKIIVQYTLVGVAAQEVLIKDNATAASVEDLDAVTKLVAESIVNQQPLKEIRKTEVSGEEQKEPLIEQRESYTLLGFSIGYLFPAHGYDTNDRSFVFDSRLCFEINRVQIGGQFSIRKGIAMNVSGAYLFTDTDLCPYVGGALGFHWVAHDEDDQDEENDLREDGFEIMVNTGLMAFRTYNFRVLLNLDYSYTFNDYDDQAITLTIGLLFPHNMFSWMRWF